MHTSNVNAVSVHLSVRKSYGHTNLSADDPVKREAAHKKLLATRKTLNDNELALVQSHMDRVSRGDFKAIETSALHIALINRFRRLRTKINELAELSF